MQACTHKYTNIHIHIHIHIYVERSKNHRRLQIFSTCFNHQSIAIQKQNKYSQIKLIKERRKQPQATPCILFQKKKRKERHTYPIGIFPLGSPLAVDFHAWWAKLRYFPRLSPYYSIFAISHNLIELLEIAIEIQRKRCNFMRYYIIEWEFCDITIKSSNIAKIE